MLVDTQKMADLSSRGKLEVLESVMSALVKDEADLAVPDWHLDVLASRVSEVNDPGCWKTLDEVRKALNA